MAWKHNSPGCANSGCDCTPPPPPTCDTTFNVNVRGCSSNLSGVTVAVKQSGSTLASGTTNASGNVTLVASAVTGSTGTVEITPPTGYNASTTAVTFNCSTQAVNVTLTPAAGYSCSPGCCPATGRSGPPYADLTYPSTIYLNDGLGTVTLTETSAGSKSYTGSASRTATDYVSCASGCPILTNGAVTVDFEVFCGDNGKWNIRIATRECGSCSEIYGTSATGFQALPTTGTIPGTQSLLWTQVTNLDASACPPGLAFNTSFGTTQLRGFVTDYLSLYVIYGSSFSVTVSQ